MIWTELTVELNNSKITTISTDRPPKKLEKYLIELKLREKKLQFL
jgi:hypothetical protein